MRYLNKKGMDISYYTVIFLTLNVVFISIMMYFVSSSSNNAFFYEQVYAKEIALFLDSAKPGMEIVLNFEKGFDIANKNNKHSSLVQIDEEKNEVSVSLKDRGGYTMTYFTNYSITLIENSQQKQVYLGVKKYDQ